MQDVAIHYSDLLISDIEETGSEFILTLPQEDAQQDKRIRFSSANDVRSVQLNNKAIETKKDGDQYILTLDLVKGENKLAIRF
jgi:hypothetical protein